MDRQLGMFAKYWQPGAVKTRLAKSVGSAAAAAVYRQSLRTSLDRFSSLAAARKLVFTPQNREAEFHELASPAWQLEPQGTGDLGARMARYFERAFVRGRSLALLIGSDSPTLPASFVERAFEALEDHSVVLGPSEDGGYYLVGVRGASVPPIFFDVDWGTERVMPQTTARLERHKLHHALLPTWYDVDTKEDLLRLDRELRQRPTADRTWTALRHEVESALRRR